MDVHCNRLSLYVIDMLIKMLIRINGEICVNTTNTQAGSLKFSASWLNTRPTHLIPRFRGQSNNYT